MKAQSINIGRLLSQLNYLQKTIKHTTDKWQINSTNFTKIYVIK